METNDKKPKENQVGMLDTLHRENRLSPRANANQLASGLPGTGKSMLCQFLLLQGE